MITGMMIEVVVEKKTRQASGRKDPGSRAAMIEFILVLPALCEFGAGTRVEECVGACPASTVTTVGIY